MRKHKNCSRQQISHFSSHSFLSISWQCLSVFSIACCCFAAPIPIYRLRPMLEIVDLIGNFALNWMLKVSAVLSFSSFFSRHFVLYHDKTASSQTTWVSIQIYDFFNIVWWPGFDHDHDTKKRVSKYRNDQDQGNINLFQGMIGN